MIDTHVHLIEPNLFSYPWLDEVPELKDSWTLDRWNQGASASEITQGLFMEVDVAPSDSVREARHFCDIADQGNSPLIGVIAACRPESPDFFEYLDRIEHPRLVGLRRVLHVAPDGTMRAPHVVENLSRLGARGLSFDLCLRADQLAGAAELLDACPNTQFVLDHAGNPPLETERMEVWRTDIKELSERPNLVCKLSGLVNHVQNRNMALSAIRHVFGHAHGCFGANRLVFGSDWPVSTLANYDVTDWSSMVFEIVSDWSQDERTSLFESNARNTYRIPKIDE